MTKQELDTHNNEILHDVECDAKGVAIRAKDVNTNDIRIILFQPLCDEDGIDYTIVNEHRNEIEGGIIDTDSLIEAIIDLTVDENLMIMEILDFDEISEQVT